MTLGLASTHAAGLLNLFRGTTYTAPAGVFCKLHTGDPGSAGTANASAVTTRNQVTYAAPSGGAIALSALAAYSMTSTETITHVSLWDAATAGTFLWSFALTVSKAVANGDTLTIITFAVSFTPIAA